MLLIYFVINLPFKDYLTKFGYLMNDDPITGKLRTQQDLEKSIKMLQRYGGLAETGQLDADTIALMGKSRCGVADFGNYKSDNTRRKKRYTLQGSYWRKRVSHILSYMKKKKKKKKKKKSVIVAIASDHMGLET